MHVKTVMSGVVFQIRNESGNVYDRQRFDPSAMVQQACIADYSVGFQWVQRAQRFREKMVLMSDTSEIEELLDVVVTQAMHAFSMQQNLLSKGNRSDQYAFDLAVDHEIIGRLQAAGLGILSEEAGELDLDNSLIAVVDPIDGSTNASRGLPWFATSICVVDADGPLTSIVANHATGDRFTAQRGAGAFCNGVPLQPASDEVGREIVGINGVPPSPGPWWQFRTFGAAALDLCAVAAGMLDGFVDLDNEAHGVWDYLGAFLVCQEAGLVMVDAFERPLVVLEHAARRTPVVASGERLQSALLDYRKS